VAHACFRPITSSVSVVSDFVANGYQTMQHVSTSPPAIPDGQISQDVDLICWWNFQSPYGIELCRCFFVSKFFWQRKTLETQITWGFQANGDRVSTD
jgi:hypothetical protein